MRRFFFRIGFTVMILLVFVGSLMAQQFGGIVQYPTGLYPTDAFVGRLNSDNRLDIAVTNRDSNTVSVFLNRANSAYYQKVDYAVGTNPSGIYGGDIDDDGDIDLVVSNKGSGNISVLKNNGSGGFASAVNYPAGVNPSAIFLIDVDDDEDIDAIITNMTVGLITVFYNDGTGSFSSSSSFNVGANTMPVALFACDFSGLGNPVDIAVVDNSGDAVIIMENNGWGAFSACGSFQVGSAPNNIHGGDIDNDGDIDLVVANYKLANAASVLINNGNCSFTVTSASNIGGGIDVYLIDINGDNLLDLVAASYTSITTALNDGNGWFYPAVSHTGDTIGRYSCVVAADVNADGDVDIVATSSFNNYMTVLRNKQICCHGLRGNVNWDPADIVDLSDLSALVNYLEGGGYVLQCEDEADVNNDGRVDLSDLSILVNYLTGGGAQLYSCD